MTKRLAIAILCLSLVGATGARAQLPITPPAEKEQVRKPVEKPTEKSAEKPAEKPKPKPLPVTAKKVPEPKAAPTPTATATPAPVPDNPNVDVVYGAYQRGEYKTSFNLALPRAQAGDTKAMTMLGELYANGLGTRRDYAKAAEWYKKASDGGDREAMLALAMMQIGRA